MSAPPKGSIDHTPWWWIKPASAIIALIAVSFFALLFSHPIQSIENRAGDVLWRVGNQQAEERRLVIVDIDEKSLQQIGPWPWPRATTAKLINELATLGAQKQIIDIVFTDPKSDDTALAQAIKTHKPVLAQVFSVHQPDQAASFHPTAGQPAGALPWPGCPAPFSQANGYLANQPSLAIHGSAPDGHTGHITPLLGKDGVVRHQPAIVCWQNQAYPALALATIMAATNDTQLVLQRGSWLEAPWQLAGQQNVVPRLPLDEGGNLRIGWHLHPDSYISVSAADVLAGNVPSHLLKGTWALIGSSAFGLNDTIATPHAAAAAGMVAHAQIITSWLDNRTPFTPRVTPLIQLLVSILGVTALWWLTGQLRPQDHTPKKTIQLSTIVLLPLAGLGLALLFFLMHAVLLLKAALWVGWVVPAMAVALAGISMASAEHLQSRLERNRLYQHLTSYLPEPVAAALARQAPSSAISASTRNVSVLFADIRNFSAYCEARPPQEAAAVLHAFFAAATQVVERHRGVIEAFQGDAIMAVWNGTDNSTLSHQNNHAQQAMAAAIDLLATSHSLLPDPAPAGLEPLQLGIGLETGLATAGSFGLASRRTHLVMGRTVTIANRLVGMTADLAHPILVGEGMANQVGGQLNNTQLQSLGTFLLDGLRVPHHVYAVPFAALQHFATSSGSGPNQST